MPLITVNMLAGRSDEAKRKLIKALTDGAVSALDAPPETVRVILHEIPHLHWGVGGVSKEPPPVSEDTSQ